MLTLTPQQISDFHEKGFLIVENVLSAEDIDAIREEYSAIIDREAPRLVAEGQLGEAFAEFPFEERYTKILHELDDMYALYQHLDISLPLLQDMYTRRLVLLICGSKYLYGFTLSNTAWHVQPSITWWN